MVTYDRNKGRSDDMTILQQRWHLSRNKIVNSEQKGQQDIVYSTLRYANRSKCTPTFQVVIIRGHGGEGKKDEEGM